MLVSRTHETSARNDITTRSIIIGLALVVVNVYWVGIASELWYSVFTMENPFSNAIFTLTLLIVFSFAVGKLSPRLSLSPSELLVVYIMVTMASTISGHTMMAILLGTMGHPFWFASPENEWQSLFWRYIPTWITVSDTEILSGYFDGSTSFHAARYLKAWSVPILAWSSFIFFLYFSLLCINSVLRKQWVENEKLSYPIVQLPLAMAADRKFFASRMMWIGFAISASIRITNGFHDLFPLVPQIPYAYGLGQLFTGKPWNAMGYMQMSFNLAVIGLTYLMPLDLSFSCWFFFWLSRAERILASTMGWRPLYLAERSSGAWIGIGLIAIWLSRRHLITFAKHLLGLARMDDSKEPLKYRNASLLFLISFIFLGGFCYFAGMSIWAILVFFALYYLLAIAIGKIRAELGPPYHSIAVNPRAMMVQIFGARKLGGANLTILTFLYAFNRRNRAHPMPCEIESLKIAEQTGMGNRKLLVSIALAIGVGVVATFWSYLQIAYKYGTLTRCRGWVGHFGWESFSPLQQWLQYPQEANMRSTMFMGFGFIFVFFLHAMRIRFLWWPLHPSGYVLSGIAQEGMVFYWFPLMVSWLAKSIVLRYGGLKMHRKALPFFFGLILGDYMPRSILSIVSLIFNLYMPSSGAGLSTLWGNR